MTEKTAERPPSPLPANQKSREVGIYGVLKRWHLLRTSIVTAVVLIAVFAATLGYIQKGLWMQQLGYTGVFWKLLFLRWGLSSAAFVVVFLSFGINIRLATRNSAASRAGLPSDSTALVKLDINVSPTALRLATFLIAAAAALVFAIIFYGQWDTYLRFRNGGSFGVSDPLFGVDLGYYMFRLPFYELLQRSLSALTLITVLLVVLLYGYSGSLRAGQTGEMASRYAKAVSHLSLLSFVLVASWGWGFYLDHYELLYSSLGVVYGAGYTADRVTRLAYWIMTGAAVALCALFLLNVFRPRFKVMVVAASVYVGFYCVAVWLVPILFQRFKVQPNELALETPYLKNNIDFTRKAFNLDMIQETSYPALADLTPEVIARNPAVGLPAPASNVPTSTRDTALLSVLPGRCGPLPSSRRLSSSDVVRARALSGASRGGPNLGQSEVAVHPRLRLGNELRFADHRRRFSTVHHREHSPRVILRPKHKAAIHLLWRVETRISDRLDKRERIRLPPRESECLHRLPRKRGYSARQLVEAPSIRVDPVGREYPVYIVPQTRE